MNKPFIVEKPSSRSSRSILRDEVSSAVGEQGGLFDCDFYFVSGL
jgi:hypothetical protein